MNQKANQEKLQKMLEDLLGSENVYYQPPAAVKMKYDAIVYDLSAMNTKYANNKPYIQMQAYTVTLITKNPNSEVIDKLKALPYCRFDRHYIADRLNHNVFTLYY